MQSKLTKTTLFQECPCFSSILHKLIFCAYCARHSSLLPLPAKVHRPYTSSLPEYLFLFSLPLWSLISASQSYSHSCHNCHLSKDLTVSNNLLFLRNFAFYPGNTAVVFSKKKLFNVVYFRDCDNSLGRDGWVKIHVDSHQVIPHLCRNPTLVLLIFLYKKLTSEYFPP